MAAQQRSGKALRRSADDGDALVAVAAAAVAAAGCPATGRSSSDMVT